MPDFFIRHGGDGSFKPARVKAELFKKGKDVEVPMKVQILNPQTQKMKVVEAEDSTPTDVALMASLTDEILADEEFYEKVKDPVEIEIVATPLDPAKTPLPGGATEIRKKFTIGVVVPPAEIFWRDLEHSELGTNPVIFVEADGEDEVQLEVWLERYIPAQKKVTKDDTVRFTHMTGPMFRPRIFGPSKKSLPWEVAPAGSPNRRDKSLWQSNAFLPDERHPETVPMGGHIRVRAWETSAITSRSPNAITAASKSIAEKHVPIELTPIQIDVKKLRPDEPVPADDTPTEVELQFTRTRTGQPLKQGEVSWELATGGDYPGGTVDPSSKVLVEADGGKVVFNYTVPAKKYKPGLKWKQDLKVYSGTAAKRQELKQPIELYVSPAIHAELAAEKKDALDFDPPYVLEIPAKQAPCEIVGHVGFKSLQTDVPETSHVFRALPIVKVITDAGEHDVHFEVRTAKDGLYTWKLPQLEPGLAKMGEDRRKKILKAFEEERPGDFTDRGEEILRSYRSYLGTGQVHATMARLTTPSHMEALRKQPAVMGKQLAEQPEDEWETVHQGTIIVHSAVRGTMIVDGIHAKLFDRGLDLMVKFLFDALDYIIKATKAGEFVLKQLAKVPGMASLGRGIQWVIKKTVYGPLRLFRRMIESRAPGLAAAIDEVLAAFEGTGDITDGLRNTVLGAQGYLKEATVELIRQMEKAALAMATSGFSPLLDDSLKYGGKKMAEKAIKEASKAAQKYIAAGNSFGSTAELKAWMRQEMPGIGLDETVQSVMRTTCDNVAKFSYDNVPGATDRYIQQLNDLTKQDLNLENNIAGIDEIVSMIDYTCDVLAIAAVAAGILSAGLALPAVIPILTAIAIPKIIGKIAIHMFQGLQLIMAAMNLQETYEFATLSLTQAVGDSS